MTILTYIIIFTLIGSVISLVGGIILLAKEKFAIKISHFLAAFAAGALLGTSFLDLLPEAAEEAGEINIFLWALIGILFFFTVERFLRWFHRHHGHSISDEKAVVPLIVVGDTIHNFVDGVIIAGTFLVSIPLGIVTTFAVAAHEIPQEIGDFGLLLHKGLKRSKVLRLNFLSALASLVGAIGTYFIGSQIEQVLPIFLSLTAGFFIYIALSDLVPELHLEEKRSIALAESLLLILGVLTIYIFVKIFEG